MDKIFFAIDLKSFYASVECQQLRLDYMNTNLVVADDRRTNKTICLAVTPSLKEYGVKGRPRLFEVEQKVKEINHSRQKKINFQKFKGKSVYKDELDKDDFLELDYMVALPQMAKYIEFSAKIYKVYLKWFSKEDIHVYSIDEVFIDATHYFNTYKTNPKELAERVVLDVVYETGITATVGIGTNMYLAKVAMDIKAKKAQANEHGVRVGFLDEELYKKQMWNHKPIDDFWRIGRGYKTRLEKIGIYTMGDIARLSLKDEDLLFKIFGVNAELLIDHAWGIEPCEIKDIKEYKPENRSLGSGQVLSRAYTFKEGRVVIFEMAESLSLELVKKGLMINQLTMRIAYDRTNLTDLSISKKYTGDVKIDPFGSMVPKSSRGTENLMEYTSSTKDITEGILRLYDRIANKDLLVRKLSISYNNLITEEDYKKKTKQLNIFSLSKENRVKEEKSIQKTILKIKERFGKNAILKGINFEENATGRERNEQIGGHKS